MLFDKRHIYTLLSLLSMLTLGCGSLHSARPLSKGETQVGITGGGAVLTQLGPPIPLPNVIVEGKTGMSTSTDHPWDISYGLNATALAFGTVGLQGGGSYLLRSQNHYIPSVSILERMHWYSNYLDTTKDPSVRGSFWLNQIDLTMAWDIKRHVGYVGIANYIDFADPELTLAPFAGLEWKSKSKLSLQLETRYLAINRKPDIVDVSFLTFGYGALSVTGSVAWRFSK